MEEELRKVYELLNTIQVDGRYWMTMIACCNSIKNVIIELESKEGKSGDEAE